jgi:peroxiredoxin
MPRLHKAGIQVMAISTALPQENRRMAASHGTFPFPLLSDPGLEVHEAWGRVDSKTHKTLPGVFLVDRKGLVAWSAVSNKPLPTDDWKSLVDNLAEEGR